MSKAAPFTLPFLPDWVNDLPLPALVLGLWVVIPTLVIGLNVINQLASGSLSTLGYLALAVELIKCSACQRTNLFLLSYSTISLGLDLQRHTVKTHTNSYLIVVNRSAISDSRFNVHVANGFWGSMATCSHSSSWGEE